MSQYDYIFNSEVTSLKKLYPLEGVVAIAVIVTLCDSELSPDDVDIDLLVDKLWDTGLFKDYSGDELLTMVEGFLDRAPEKELGILFNAAYASLTDDLVPKAFAIGVMMLLDDSGMIPPEKQEFLQELQQVLKLENNEAQQIVDNVIVAAKTAEQDNILSSG